MNSDGDAFFGVVSGVVITASISLFGIPEVTSVKDMGIASMHCTNVGQALIEYQKEQFGMNSDKILEKLIEELK